MNRATKFFYRIGIWKLTLQKVNLWSQNADLDKLIFSHRNGNYQVRLLSLESMVMLDSARVNNELLFALDDKVEKVSQFAIAHFQRNTQDPAVLNRVYRKIAYWRSKKKGRTSLLTFQQSKALNFTEKYGEHPSDRLQRRAEEQSRMNDFGY